MIDLERDLIALGAALEVPADDQLAARVRASIARPPSRSRRPWVVLAIAFAAGATGLLAAPVVADWLGVGGVEVRLEPPPTTTRPSTSGLDLGLRSTLSEASKIAGFDVVVPSALGQPDEVWLDTANSIAIVWLAYRPRPGLPEAVATGYGALVAQADAAIANELVATKFAEPDTKIEPVEIGTGRALWVQGTHYIGLHDRRNGYIVADRLRLSDNVLLWERGNITMRFESALGRDESVRIAQSVP